ncbi:hypothetical protein PoB_003031500 [Plakobranchus ocellatus]|uniref:Uncharacterized protein n=1 Tax=Plakobranchus ocellatus TaxID=259542 RepID=A0AAV4AAH7_9GAST|nr:hypothetical protein PoB_003031500 [Plakobranchus ocellatus]
MFGAGQDDPEQALYFCISITVHSKVISGFQALHQARALVMGLEPASEGSLQNSRRIPQHSMETHAVRFTLRNHLCTQ